MSEKIDDLALPSAVIMRILKDTIPDGINISREARATFARAAAIFALYITACSTHVLASTQRKTLTASDVFTALNDMLLDHLVDPIKEALEAFHADKEKKATTATSPSKASTGGGRGRRKKSQTDSSSRENESASTLQDITATDAQENEQTIESTDLNMSDVNSTE